MVLTTRRRGLRGWLHGKDEELFKRIARSELPHLDETLRRLTHAVDH